MAVYVPTLSRAGWSKGLAERIDYLLADFFTAEYSQSYIFNGSISSLTYLIQKYQSDVPGLVTATRGMLEDYLGGYFDSVLVDVSSDLNSVEKQDGSITLAIYCQVTENGKEYSIATQIESIDSKISKIVNFNNTGVLE